mmetsp:Transcript_9223/g.21820  ORF Transcript_9223/g.21820 Transcript_9223/m.21820 type:complete len:200 (+) Transcript_9223:2963-3562(+)
MSGAKLFSKDSFPTSSSRVFNAAASSDSSTSMASGPSVAAPPADTPEAASPVWAAGPSGPNGKVSSVLRSISRVSSSEMSPESHSEGKTLVPSTSTAPTKSTTPTRCTAGWCVLVYKVIARMKVRCRSTPFFSSSSSCELAVALAFRPPQQDRQLPEITTAFKYSPDRTRSMPSNPAKVTATSALTASWSTTCMSCKSD